MLFLMFYVCLSKYFNNGPYWAPEVLAPDDCKDTWWKNILYINNIVESDKMVSVVLMAIQIGKFVDVAHFLKTLRLYSVYTSKRFILTIKIAYGEISPCTKSESKHYIHGCVQHLSY